MKINNNISAVISNKHLLRNENSIAISMERLSSGYKINHSGDDPSGMAISSKMRAQIRGLDQASDNSSDGMSVLETADGALNEVTDMIQRMRELSVQAANGTMSDSDRKSIQDEINALTDEIDRVAETTEFNTKKLLDGSLDKRIYTEGISRVQLSDEVPAGKYEFDISSMPTHTTLTGGLKPDGTRVTWSDLKNVLEDREKVLSDELKAKNMERAEAGLQPVGGDTTARANILINGSAVTLTSGMTEEDIYRVVRDAAELGEAKVGERYDYFGNSNTFQLISVPYGDEAQMDVEMDAWFSRALGLTEIDDAQVDTATLSSATAKTWEDMRDWVNKQGKDVTITVNDVDLTLQAGMDMGDFYDAIKGAFGGELTLSGSDAIISFEKKTSGSIGSISVSSDAIPDTLAKDMGLFRVTHNPSMVKVDVEQGKNAEITLKKEGVDGSRFGSQATYKTVTKETGGAAGRSVDGRRIEITDVGGFEIDFLIDDDLIEDINEKMSSLQSQLDTANKSLAEKNAELATETDPVKIAQLNTEIADLNNTIQGLNQSIEDLTQTFEIEVTDVGPMNLQIGANESQQMTVRIDSISAKKLYLDQVSVLTERGATRALEQLDEALAAITTTRSAIGAYTNRLEHAVKSLDETSENMEAAISRIQDMDMAEEMTEYTKFNVLQQSSTSALSQANELPQTALQLLQ